MKAKIIGHAYFGKDVTVDIKLPDGTEISISTRLEHMHTPIQFNIRYPNGETDEVSSALDH